MSVSLPDVFGESARDSKFLLRVKRRAANNFKWTHAISLEKVIHFACWLYIYDRTEDALQVCRFLAQAQFSGNLKPWFWIQSALILQSRILKAEGSTQESDDCLNRVRSVGNDDYRLGGAILQRYERRVDDALADTTGFSKPNEIVSRIMVLVELFFLIEMDASPTLPSAMLEDKVAANVSRLRFLTEK